MEEEAEKLVANRNSLDADAKRLSDEKITLALENRFLREARANTQYQQRSQLPTIEIVGLSLR